MLTKSNTNFLPAFNNPHSISLANRVSNNVDIMSPFITNAHNEMLAGGLQGINRGLGSIDFTDPVTWAIGGIVGIWLLHGVGMKKLLGK